MGTSQLANLIGGIGLFLLGMGMMTEGLKLSAGAALRRLLSRWTGTPLRGLLSGALITSIVQSSSAVTVATLGFVNAGLMGLGQAVRVVYGSNVGTTATGWLVAIVGFHVNIAAFALPLVGAGMLLRLARPEQRLGAVGQALAGFGLFFLGIDLLREAFGTAGHGLDLGPFVREGLLGVLIFTAIGFALTTAMQSSSAAMALTLTAAAGGVVPLGTAAATVIGCNLGTTSTAVLAVIGATPNSKRVAAAHVGFNAITGAIALAMLPLLLSAIDRVSGALGLGAGPPAVLAAFHTTFNLLGVALLWPFTDRLVGWLETRFRSAEEDEARPRFLDRNAIATPAVALHAVGLELARIGAMAGRMARAAVLPVGAPPRSLEADRVALDTLVERVGEYVNRMQQGVLPRPLLEVLPATLRISRHFAEVAELAARIAPRWQAHEALDPELAKQIGQLRAGVAALIEAADVRSESYSAATCSAELAALEEQYQALKAELLRAGTMGRTAVRQVVDLLDLVSDMRRLAQQAERGARRLAALRPEEQRAAAEAGGSESEAGA